MIIVFLENNHKIDFCLFASLVYRGLYGARMRNGAEERTTSEHTKLASRCALSSCLPPPARSRGLPPCRVGWADRPMAATGRGIPSPARRTAPPKRPAPLAPWARAGKPSGRPAESPRRRRRRWQRRLRPGRRQWQRALQVSLTPALAPNPRPHSRRHPRPVPLGPPCPPPSAPTRFLSPPPRPIRFQVLVATRCFQVHTAATARVTSMETAHTLISPRRRVSVACSQVAFGRPLAATPARALSDSGRGCLSGAAEERRHASNSGIARACRA